MASLSLIFHLVSALVFLGMGLWLIRLRAGAAYTRRLFACLPGRSGDGRPPVLVDWPPHFLQRYCQAFGIPLEAPRTRPDGAPVRIRPAPWLELVCQQGIRRIRCGKEGMSPRIGVQLVAGRADGQAWEDKLRDSLGKDWKISVRTEEAGAG